MSSYPAEYSLNKSWRFFRRLEKIEKGDAFSMNKTYILPLPLGKNTFLFSCKTEESKVVHKMKVHLNESSIICVEDCTLEGFKVTDVCKL